MKVTIKDSRNKKLDDVIKFLISHPTASRVGAAIAVGVAGTVASSEISGSAAQGAANTEAAGQAAAGQTELQMFDEQAALQSPWRSAGITALDQLSSLTSPYSNFFPTIGGTQTTAQGTPGSGTPVPNMYNTNPAGTGQFAGAIPSGYNPGYGPGVITPSTTVGSPATSLPKQGATSFGSTGNGITSGPYAAGGIMPSPSVASQYTSNPSTATPGTANPVGYILPGSLNTSSPAMIAAGPSTTKTTPNSTIATNTNTGLIGSPATSSGSVAPGTQSQSGSIGAFNYNPASVVNDPAFQFESGQGIKAIQAAAAAKGQSYSPATAAAIGQMVTGTAATYENQDYSQALSSYNQNFADTMQSKQFMLDALQSLGQVGQTATNATSSAAGTAGTNIANTQIGAANASAAGEVGTANAISGGINGLGSTLGTAYALQNANATSGASAAGSGKGG